MLLGLIIPFGCAFQRKLIFPATRLPDGYPLIPYLGAQEVMLTAEDGVSINALVFRNFKSRKIILYFHGNGGAAKKTALASFPIGN